MAGALYTRGDRRLPAGPKPCTPGLPPPPPPAAGTSRCPVRSARHPSRPLPGPGAPTALGAEVLQDAGQGPAAGQVSQGPGTAGDQEGVVPGTWGRPQAGQSSAPAASRHPCSLPPPQPRPTHHPAPVPPSVRHFCPQMDWGGPGEGPGPRRQGRRWPWLPRCWAAGLREPEEQREGALWAADPPRPPTPTVPRSWALTVDGLQLRGAGVGLEAEVLHPTRVALVHVHKVHGLPLPDPEARGQPGHPLLARGDAQNLWWGVGTDGSPWGQGYPTAQPRHWGPAHPELCPSPAPCWSSVSCP